ncbi:hypothetical protein Tco_1566887, partial [Tanacetum coccineum]
MASTSNELLQPWFICSMEYFGSYDVEHEPPLIGHDVEHERQLLLQGQPVGENLVVALERQSEPDVAVERQSKPDMLKSIVLQQLAAVKERITAIETFLKYKNEFVSEDFVVYWISQYKFRNDGLAKFLKRESNLSSERKH